MSNRRFEMYQYRQIIMRLRMGDSIRSLAKEKLADRKTISKINELAKEKGWLVSQCAIPSDEVLARFFGKKSSSSLQSLILPQQKQIEEWCMQGIQATTIYSHLKQEYGFVGSYSVIQRFIKRLKDNSSPVTTILEFSPGECVQVDFGAGPSFVDERTGEVSKTWIFVMVLAFSRHMYAEIVLRQDVETWLGCHRRAFEWFNGVPKKIVIDNAKCAITKACYNDPVVQRSYAEFAQGYGFIISPCPPYDPQKKGRVESGVKYVKNKFVPLRTHRNIVSSNQALTGWLLEEAGQRIHGSTRERPLTLFEMERHTLQPLPDKPPELAVWQKVKLHGDCHVQYLKCRYSVSYRLVRQTLWLRATETTVRIYHNHNLVALHPRLFKPGSKNTLDEHLPPNALAYQMRDAQWCLKQATDIGEYCQQAIQKLLTDSVIDYLRAAQNVVGLRKKFGDERLELACKRALAFQSIHYKTIKSILEAGVENEPLPCEKEPDALAETYTAGGRFCRDTSSLLH